MIRLAAIWNPFGAVSGAGKPALGQMLDMMARHSRLPKNVAPEEPSFLGGLLSHTGQESAHLWTDPSTGAIILFDGTIYNVPELSAELQLSPSTSNALLLFRAHQKWGRACLNHFEGRWAFLYYHPQHGVWAARDRFGVKPLYYLRLQNEIYFASEQKAFLALPHFPFSLDPAAVFDFFIRQRAGTGAQDLIQGVQQIMPGTEILVEPQTGRVRKSRWYQLRYLKKTTSFNDSKAIDYQEEISETLQDSFNRRQLQYQTGEVASFLSGGLDSSLIAALLAAGNRSIPAITATYPGESISEGHWAGRVVEHLGLPWIQVTPKLEDLRHHWEAFYFSQDAPTFSFGTFNQFQLFQAARKEGFKAVFDGQAADALFAGHDYFLPGLWHDLLKSKQFAVLSDERKIFGGRLKSWRYYLRNYAKYYWMPRRSGSLQLRVQKRLDPALRYFQDDFLRQYQDRLTLQQTNEWGLNQMLHGEFMNGEVLGLLKCLDRAGSHSGVDPITPFADDHQLIERLFSIPSVYKMHLGQSKYLLRRVARHVLPQEVVYRTDKMGLVAPNNRWMQAIHQEMRPYFEDLDPVFFNRDLLLKEYDQFFGAEREIENFRVYKYMAFALWRASVQHYTGRAI